MDSKFVLIDLDDYEESSEEQPILYTRDIHSCIVALIHRQDSAIMMHIEAIDNTIKINNFLDVLEELQEEIKNIDLFYGLQTNEENINKLISIANQYGIDTNVFSSYIDEYGNGSIAYDQQLNSYYGVVMQNGIATFTDYKLKNRGI